MTKSQEIELLDKTIKAFGTDSYLGPWLAESRAAIAADISNDVCINVPMPAAARRVAEDLLTAARAEADRIVADAKAQAALELKRLQETLDGHRMSIRRQLEGLLARV